MCIVVFDFSKCLVLFGSLIEGGFGVGNDGANSGTIVEVSKPVWEESWGIKDVRWVVSELVK